MRFIRKRALGTLLALLLTVGLLPSAQAAAQVVVSNRPVKAGAPTQAEQPAAVLQRAEPKAPPAAKKADAKPQTESSAKQAATKAKPAKQQKQKNKNSKSNNRISTQAKAEQSGGWKLKVAQQKLRLLGYSKEQPSGKMTTATAEALRSFQKQHKLKASGELDADTYKQLNWEAFRREGISGVSGKDVVKQAARYKGVPYRFGGTTPKGFDCSAYVQYVFRECRAELPRTADAQALQGIFVTQRQLKPGDLVFFTTYAAGASHVGIYAGDEQFWSASSSRGVVLSSLKEAYWHNSYYGARRVLVSNGAV